MRFLRDIPLKATAVFFAVLLWFHVATNQRYDLEVEYNLAFVNLPDSLVIAGDHPSSVTVMLRGSGKGLLRLLWSDRRWPIDMTRTKVGLQQVILTADHVPVYGIKGLEVLDLLDADTLNIAIDSLGRKTVPVQSAADLRTAPGFICSRLPILTPDSVELVGGRGALLAIHQVYTERFTATDLREPTERILKLTQPRMPGISMSVSAVQLYQHIEPYLSREFPSVPVTIDGADPGEDLDLWPRRVMVAVGGPQSAVTRLVADSIRVACNPSFAGNGRAIAKAVAVVPPPLEVLKVSPDSVTVERRGRARADSGD